MLTSYRPALLILSIIIGSSILFAAPTPAPALEPTSMMRRETQWVVSMLERAHFTQRPLTDLNFNDFIINYMASLDPNRLYFLQEEVDEFKVRFAGNMRAWLRRGDLYPAFEIFSRFRERALARTQWIDGRLNEPFDLLAARSYQPDRRESDWPATAEESDRLWDLRLTFDILNDVLPDISTKIKNESFAITAESLAELTPASAEKIRRRYQRWRENLLEIDAFSIQETYVTALTQLYDPHSTFMSADTMDEFAMSMRNSFVGIGALLFEEDGYCTIRELLPGGPAEASRELASGDVIVGVAQGMTEPFVDVIDMSLKKIVKLIKGEPRTPVRLKIRPSATSSEERVVTLIRDEIKLTANLASASVYDIPMGDRSVPIGVIHLPSFYGGEEPGVSNTTNDVKELIGKLQNMAVEGLVIDLRRNGGGLLSEAINLTGLFMPPAPVVRIKDSMGNTRDRFTETRDYVWSGPLAVLVSRFSASASEIVAGALQSQNRAIVIGDETTHGKGTVQAIFNMPNRSLFSQLTEEGTGAAKITIQKFYLPNGSSTQNLGVSSDIVIPSTNMLLPIGESDNKNALPWETIDPVRWDLKPEIYSDIQWIDRDLRDILITRSAERLKTLLEFEHLAKHIAWFDEQRNKKDVSLSLTERLSEREANERFGEMMDEQIRIFGEHNYPHFDIPLDIRAEQDALNERYRQDIVAIRGDNVPENTVGSDDEEGQEKDELPDFDIHLREALRVTRDWIALNKGIIDTVEAEPLLMVEKSADSKVRATGPATN